jgi:hypothetical protein
MAMTGLPVPVKRRGLHREQGCGEHAWKIRRCPSGLGQFEKPVRRFNRRPKWLVSGGFVWSVDAQQCVEIQRSESS